MQARSEQKAVVAAATAAFWLAGSILCASSVAAQESAAVKGEIEPGVTIEVTKLARIPGKDIVELRFDLVNDSTSPVSLQGYGAAGLYSLSDLRLIDFQNAISYHVGQVSGERLSSHFDDGGKVQSGERRSFWAWFKAPPAGVKVVAVQVPSAPPILDVPVSP